MKTLQEIVTVTTNNIGITVKIDYQKNRISVIEPNQNYNSKKFIFAERGIEYINGWLNILEAIKEAIKFAKDKMEKHLTHIDLNKSKPLELEDHNFRVDSSNFPERKRNGFRIKENGKQDIIEFTDGELKGEQLFTWEAAMRETKKAGKRIPTDEEFKKLLKSKKDIENVVYSGYRSTDGSFYNQGTNALLWSSSESGSNAWNLNLDSSNTSVFRYSRDKADGFSVRCLKD